MILPTDVQAAFGAAWTAAGLGASVGTLYSGRVPGDPVPTPPYAVVKATKAKEQNYTEGDAGRSGAPYVSWWDVTLQVYGFGETKTGTLANTAHTGLAVDSLSVTGATSLVHVYLKDDYPKVEEDTARTQGEDVWRGELGYEVCLAGVY